MTKQVKISVEQQERHILHQAIDILEALADGTAENLNISTSVEVPYSVKQLVMQIANLANNIKLALFLDEDPEEDLEEDLEEEIDD